MNLFKQKKDDTVEQYKNKLIEMLNCLDTASLNNIFVELTLLNIKLDKNDGFFSKVRDYKKRNKKQDIKVKEYIELQFDDIMYVTHPYDSKQILLIKETFNRIIPAQEKNFLDWLIEHFDNVAGRRK